MEKKSDVMMSFQLCLKLTDLLRQLNSSVLEFKTWSQTSPSSGSRVLELMALS